MVEWCYRAGAECQRGETGRQGRGEAERCANTLRGHSIIQKSRRVQRVTANTCQSATFPAYLLLLLFLIRWSQKVDKHHSHYYYYCCQQRWGKCRVKKKNSDYTRYSLTPFSPLRLWIYKRYLSISFSTSSSVCSPVHPHVQTVTSVLLLVGSPLCLGCMCGEWP